MSSILLEAWLEDSLTFSLLKHGRDELSVAEDPPYAYGEPLSKSIEMSMGGSIRSENMTCIGGWMQTVIVPISTLKCTHTCLSLSSSLSFSNGLAGLPFSGIDSGIDSGPADHPGDLSLIQPMPASTAAIHSRRSKFPISSCVFDNSSTLNDSPGNVDDELARCKTRPLLRHNVSFRLLFGESLTTFETADQKMKDCEHRVLEVVDRSSHLCSKSDGDFTSEASDAIDSSDHEDIEYEWVVLKATSE